MRKIIFLSLFVLIISLFVTSGKMDNKVKTDTVVYDETKGIKGYLAEPDGMGKKPAIILIHEWWGLNDYIKERTRDFAKLGYVALAVDLYEGKVADKPEDARTYATAVRNDVKTAFDNLSQAIEYLKKREDVDPDRLASIGWCFGGQWSYEVAKNNLGVRVSIMYYGRFHPSDDLEQMKALLIGHFGEEDGSIKVDDVKEFQMTLKSENGDHEIYIYPNAGHAFDNKYGKRYNEKASKLAWKRSVKFLKKHLK